ncbi:MAG: cell envelope integrity protein TolA [Proteobacteria bacterium]|nr:cell envelope integrity protein TolA [Pseudomonadota bacterium]
MEMASNQFLNIPKPALIASLVFHLVLGGTVIFMSANEGTSLAELFFGKKSEISAQSFVQVDVVGLPDQLINEKINPLLPEVAKPETSTQKPVEAKTAPKDVMEDALTKMKKEKTSEKRKEKEQEQALREALEEAKREQALKGLQSKSGTTGRGKIKGNMLSEGTSSSGIVGTAKDKYVGVLTESIKQQFNIFSWQQKKGLMAEVKLMLLPNGRVKWRKIVKPSRDILYDSAVLQAIDDAQPFPVPEDRGLLEDEITINFKP